jgi:hypothetical protein
MSRSAVVPVPARYVISTAGIIGYAEVIPDYIAQAHTRNKVA